MPPGAGSESESAGSSAHMGAKLVSAGADGWFISLSAKTGPAGSADSGSVIGGSSAAGNSRGARKEGSSTAFTADWGSGSGKGTIKSPHEDEEEVERSSVDDACRTSSRSSMGMASAKVLGAPESAVTEDGGTTSGNSEEVTPIAGVASADGPGCSKNESGRSASSKGAWLGSTSARFSPDVDSMPKCSEVGNASAEFMTRAAAAASFSATGEAAPTKGGAVAKGSSGAANGLLCSSSAMFGVMIGSSWLGEDDTGSTKVSEMKLAAFSLISSCSVAGTSRFAEGRSPASSDSATSTSDSISRNDRENPSGRSQSDGSVVSRSVSRGGSPGLLSVW